jgi:hypothetical protein
MKIQVNAVAKIAHISQVEIPDDIVEQAVNSKNGKAIISDWIENNFNNFDWVDPPEGLESELDILITNQINN